jgi:hypothetical protein
VREELDELLGCDEDEGVGGSIGPRLEQRIQSIAVDRVEAQVELLEAA